MRFLNTNVFWVRSPNVYRNIKGTAIKRPRVKTQLLYASIVVAASSVSKPGRGFDDVPPDAAYGVRFCESFGAHSNEKNLRLRLKREAVLESRSDCLDEAAESAWFSGCFEPIKIVRSQNVADESAPANFIPEVDIPFLSAANESQEPPHVKTSASDFAAGSCAANDRFHASREEVLRSVLPITNRPLDRPYSTWTMPDWSPPGPADFPRPGHPEDTFLAATFTAERNGPYIASLLIREYGGAKFVELSAAEVFAHWVRAGQIAVNDMVQRRQADLAGNPGSHSDVGLLFIIHSDAIRGHGKWTWDYREWIQAWECNAPKEVMDLIAVGWIVEDERVEMDLHTANMLKWLDKIGSKDDFMRYQVEFGFLFKLKLGKTREIAFRNNAASAKFHTDFCEQTADEEGMLDITSSEEVSVDGVVQRVAKFWPLPPLSGQNFAVGVQESSNKLRSLTDMTAAADLQYFTAVNGEDADDYSLNANIDMGLDADAPEMRHKLSLPSSRTFCLAVAVLKASGLRVKIGKMDWSGFYRQIVHSKRCLWFAVKLMSCRGFSIDKALPFGNRKGPEMGNELNDVVICFIKWQFRENVRSMDAEVHLRRLSGLATESDNDWHGQRIVMSAYFVERRAELLSSYPSMTDAEVDEQCDYDTWQGFYDDGSFATFEIMFDLLVRTALELADDIQLKVSLKKTECGTTDGQCGTLDLGAWAKGDIAWLMSSGPDFHFMTVLGKEVDMVNDIERDTAARIVQFEERLLELRKSRVWRKKKFQSVSVGRNGLPCRNDRCTVATQPSARLIGLAFFMIRTESSLRSLMNWPVRVHRAAYGIKSSTSSFFRKSASFSSGTTRGGVRCERAAYSTEVDDTWSEIGVALAMRRGIAFMPALPVPGSGGRKVVRVMADAAGQQTEPGVPAVLDPLLVACDFKRGGGLWFWSPETDVSGGHLMWHFWSWCKDMLVMHSTFLEGANCIVGVLIAAEQFGAQDVIVHMDSLAWVMLTRRLAAKSESVAPLIKVLALLLAKLHVRLFVVHQVRELGTVADDISKFAMSAVNAEMSSRGLVGLSLRNRVPEQLMGLERTMADMRSLAAAEAQAGIAGRLSQTGRWKAKRPKGLFR